MENIYDVLLYAGIYLSVAVIIILATLYLYSQLDEKYAILCGLFVIIGLSYHLFFT